VQLIHWPRVEQADVSQFSPESSKAGKIAVVGKGMMARAFSSYEASAGVLVFASGVSDSQGNSEAAFQREEDLLRESLETSEGMIFIYFGTCSTYDPTLKESAYVKHKMRMEEVTAREAKKYLIFRLPQAVGVTTSKTLVNYIWSMVQSGERFEVWTKAYRNLIDCEDAFRICSYVIDRRVFVNRTVNVASTVKVAVPKVVEIVERILNKKGNYVLVDKGCDCDIDLTDILPTIRELGIEFDEKYPERVVRKYYARNDQPPKP